MKKTVYTVGSLIILLIAAFIFVLVPMFSGGSKASSYPEFGSYDGTPIKYEQGSDFSNYVARYADYFKNQNIEINDSNYYYIFNYAFNSTVTQIAYTKAVKKSGWQVPQGAINRQLMNYFVDETGTYSPRLYKLADKSQVSELQEALKKDLTYSRYSEDSFGSSDSIGKNSLYGLKSSNSENEFLQNLNSTKRSFNMAVFDMNNYPDSEKIAYGKENESKFMKYDLSVITLADKRSAQKVLKAIQSEEKTFEDAVANDSQKSYSNANGKMTSQYFYQLENIVQNPEDLAKITALEEGALSEPIQTTIGYTIFKADTKVANPDFNDSAILSSVYNYITTNEYSRIEEYYTSQAEKFAQDAKTTSFNAACTKYGAENVSVPAFPINYGNVSVADKIDTSIKGLSGADSNEAFIKEAYNLPQGELSSPIVNGRNILVLQLVNESTNNESQTTIDALNAEIKNYDAVALQDSLMNSPKLKNNLQDVFFNYMMNNN